VGEWFEGRTDRRRAGCVSMKRWMKEWMGEWMDEWMDGMDEFVVMRGWILEMDE